MDSVTEGDAKTLEYWQFEKILSSAEKLDPLVLKALDKIVDYSKTTSETIVKVDKSIEETNRKILASTAELSTAIAAAGTAVVTSIGEAVTALTAFLTAANVALVASLCAPSVIPLTYNFDSMRIRLNDIVDHTKHSAKVIDSVYDTARSSTTHLNDILNAQVLILNAIHEIEGNITNVVELDELTSLANSTNQYIYSQLQSMGALNTIAADSLQNLNSIVNINSDIREDVGNMSFNSTSLEGLISLVRLTNQYTFLIMKLTDTSTSLASESSQSLYNIIDELGVTQDKQDEQTQLLNVIAKQNITSFL